MSAPYKIVAVSAKDFGPLEAASVEGIGHLLYVIGPNGVGKSAFLTALESLLGLPFPETAVRDGQRDGVVTGEIHGSDGETYRVRARGRMGKKNDGTPSFSRQYTITRLVNGIELDVKRPAEFMRTLRGDRPIRDLGELLDSLRTPDGQRKFITQALESAGVDVAALDAAKARAYDSRRDANADVKRVEATLASLPVPPPDTPLTEVSLSELTELVALAEAENAARQRKIDGQAVNIQTYTTAAMRLEAVGIPEAERRVERLRNELVQAEADLEEHIAEHQTNEEAAETARTAKALAEAEEVMDAEEFRKQLAGAEAVNAEVRLRAKRAEFEREAEVARRRAEAVNAEIVQAAAARTKALADASIGVAGLEFTEDGEATYKGDPLMRMSDGQKAAILAQFLLAGDPPFPLILWRRASLLDPAHLADFCRVVREKGAQAVLELVQETEGGLMLVAADDGTLPTSK